ncbi:hypothetical protein JCM6882_005190 [Rhodosporidiobolus microsporus]
MPSYVAWGAAILSAVVGRLLPMPLGLLQGLLPLPTLFAFLRFPFLQMSAFVLLLGAGLQTGMLIEELAMDKLGTSLNSAAKSSSSPSLPSLRASLAEAEEQLSRFSTLAYPSTVSRLLDEPLALPTIPEDSEITFTAADIQEWEDGSRSFRSEFERLAEQAARQWVDVLSFEPSRSASFLPNPADPPTAPSSSSPKLADPVFLATVQAEILLIQAGRPSKAIYAEQEYGEEEWAREKEEKERREAKELAKQDAQFEDFLDKMFAGAEAAAGAGDEGGDADSSSGDSTSSSPPSPSKRPRELLDQPQNPNLPVSPTNPTWRMTLRNQWEVLYDPSQGGILGATMQSLSLGLGALGEDDDDEDEEGGEERGADSKSWRPKDLPLMANHLLRDHNQQATALSAPQVSAWEKVWGVNPKEEERILPSVLSGIRSEFLSPMQRAVRVDQQARKWATSFLSLFLTPPPLAPAASAPSDPRAAATLLRSSPFPAFFRTVDALFALPLDHMRIGVSKHEMAYVVFANGAQMEQGGKAGAVGRIGVEWAARQVAQLKRDVDEAEKRIEREGRAVDAKEEL